MVSPEDRSLLLSLAVDRATLSDHPFDLEFRLIRPDGKIVSLISRGRIIDDAPAPNQSDRCVLYE
jgi:hypothetical protein